MQAHYRSPQLQQLGKTNLSYNHKKHFLFKYNIQEQVIWIVCSNTNVSLEYYIPICPPFFSNTNITRLSKELVRFSISVQSTSLHAA